MKPQPPEILFGGLSEKRVGKYGRFAPADCGSTLPQHPTKDWWAVHASKENSDGLLMCMLPVLVHVDSSATGSTRNYDGFWTWVQHYNLEIENGEEAHVHKPEGEPEGGALFRGWVSSSAEMESAESETSEAQQKTVVVIKTWAMNTP